MMRGPNTTAGEIMDPTGETLLPPDPLAPTFGVRLCNNDMAPAYRSGDIVLLRPRGRSETLKAGNDYFFALGTKKGIHGQPVGGINVCLANLKRATGTHWVCERYGARGLRLSRSQWRTVYIVTGLYRTSNPALKEGGAA